jgi:hypothetical protein
MRECEPSAGEASPTAASVCGTHDRNVDGQRRYTGVVLIHGLGDIKRNAMLQQALNALSYWFNHVAGFALGSEGPGRLWLTTQLTDDDNPDAEAARATVELAAPTVAMAGTPTGISADDPGLHLEFREVWWAESFGLPDIGRTIQWARVQWREQATHLLLPLGRRLGPAKTAMHEHDLSE